MANGNPVEMQCCNDIDHSDLYNVSNPDGIIDLSTAENRLVSSILMSKIESPVNLKDPSVLNYGTAGGSMALCSAFRDFMLQICQTDIDESQLIMVCGGEIAIEILLKAICKPGDKVAVIIPCYTGFTRVIRRLGMNLVPINIDLDAEIGMPDLANDVKAVLISNPDVPTGRCWTRSALQALVNASRKNGQHLIVDEIVSTAVCSEDSFISATSFISNNVHIVAGLSKLGLAGLRIGAIYTKLPRAVITDLSRIAEIGSVEQILTVNVLNDLPFMTKLLEQSRILLRDAYAITADRLENERLEYKLGSAGLTVLLNLGRTDSLLKESRVVLKNLVEFGSQQREWYRMTLSHDSQIVATAINRIASHVRRHSPISLLPAYTKLFKDLWKRTEGLWAILQVNDNWLKSRPIQLRHPFIFYVGHLPAFAMNQICLALGEENVKRINAEFDRLFERGIDPDVLSGEVHPHSAEINQSWWPSIADINRYVEDVHETILISLPMMIGAHRGIIEMILEHEQMHQETLIYMMAQCAPSELQRPISVENLPRQNPATKQRICHIPAGNAKLGREGSPTTSDRFAWDNEFPKVTINVKEFKVMSLPVSNGEFLQFINHGGYSKPALWSERHWKWIQTETITHPASWRFNEDNRQWFVRTSLFQYEPLDQVLDYPVIVSLAEATAYCRYVGARIMTEPEYCRAAYGDNVDQPYPWGYLPTSSVDANVNFQSWSLRPSGIGNMESCFGVADLVGQAWEWTSSVFSPLLPDRDFATMPTYPGYSSEFFDGKHFIMKGGSWATDSNLLRPSFRNWYQDCYHYAFAKFRLVYDTKDLCKESERDIVCLMDKNCAQEQKSSFSSSIKAGLLSTPKTIHSVHFYDNRGSKIYENITELDSYYLTKTEAEILNKSAVEIAYLLHHHQNRYQKQHVNVVEFGAGDGKKTIPLLKRLHDSNIDLRYFPIDISEGALHSLQENLISSSCKFESTFILGDNIRGLEYLSKEASAEALTLVLFLGSSIGNYSRAEASRMMQQMRANLRTGDMVLIGFDLVKSTEALIPAYDDDQGITAEFNYNLIHRLNNELNAQIPLDAFQHYATFNPRKRRMESYLIATKPLEVILRAESFQENNVKITFDAWEPIHVENSYKYTLKDIEAFGSLSGFHLERSLLDDKRWFSDTIFYVA